jgi:hypothetical protein
MFISEDWLFFVCRDCLKYSDNSGRRSLLLLLLVVVGNILVPALLFFMFKDELLGDWNWKWEKPLFDLLFVLVCNPIYYSELELITVVSMLAKTPVVLEKGDYLLALIAGRPFK